MFEKTNRVGVFVYLYYNRDARKLNKYGDVLYHSRKLRYELLYVEKELLDQVVEELSQMKFVKEVKVSELETIDTNFVGSLRLEDELKSLE